MTKISRLIWALPLLAVSAAQADTSFKFTLDSAYTTTAGAYNSDGTLVRTIWKRVLYAAGTFNGTWDDRDDEGKTVPPGTYSIKVLFHNVQPVWDGAFIGNTSDGTKGRWHGFRPIQSIVITGNTGYTACGYNEGQAGFYRFDTAAPQAGPAEMTGADIRVLIAHLATDGKMVYAANSGGAFGGNLYSYTVAYQVSDNSQYAFPSGGTCSIPNAGTYQHCIDIDKDPSNPPARDNDTTGIAVQAAGNILAISHGPRNSIRLFDKTSGAPTSSISIPSPGELSFAPNGDLWAVASGSVVRFEAATLGTTDHPATVLTGLSNPLSVAVNPADGDDVLVADGGNSQQVKAFDHTGKLLWSYGQLGGYAAHGITVTDDKFSFHLTEDGDYTALTVLPDGSFWIGDTNACRLLHLSAQRSLIEKIAYTSAGYEGEADAADPARVFGSGFLEYHVDYAKPLGGNNGSWSLVRNWAGNLPSDSPYLGFGCGPKHILTMSNGRTYAQSVYRGGRAIIELTEAGIRDTGTRLTHGQEDFYADGSLRWGTMDSSGLTTIYRQAFSNFDDAGNPQWAAPEILASLPTAKTDPSPFGAFDPTLPITSSKILVTYRTNLEPGDHLGGLPLGGKSFLWKAAPSVTSNDPVDGLGTYDIGNGVTYGGNSALVLGRNIIMGYHGEFWSGNEMSQWMHYYDDGLFVTQFGVPAKLSVGEGFAGNAFSSTLLKVGSRTYLYHNDESGVGAVLRWHLLGLDSIQESTGAGTLGSNITLTAPPPTFPTGLTAVPGSGRVTLHWHPAAGAASYNVKYSTHNGGPYTVIPGVKGESAVIPGLTNEVPYYLAVSATVGGVESAESNQVRTFPYDRELPVHPAGHMPVSFFLPLAVRSSAPPKGEPALTSLPRDLNDVTTKLQLDRVGGAGYYLWDQGGAGVDAVSIAPPFSVKLGSGWKHVDHVNDQISVDGGARSAQTSLSANPIGTVDIGCSDSLWHCLTVLSSDVFNSPRDFRLRLTPADQSSAGAAYVIHEGGIEGGHNQIFQFFFRGNVTMAIDGTGGGEGNLRGIFLDDVPN